MRNKTIGLAFALLCFAVTAAFADSPQMGTWKLNTAKSKFAPHSPRNKTVVYDWGVFQLNITIDGTDAEGKPAHNEWRGSFDGQDHHVWGDPTSDTRAYKKVDDHNLIFVSKKDGKIVATGRIVVSADGKTRTVTTFTTNAKGKKVRSKAVYNKQ
jgi:hypothetical protein